MSWINVSLETAIREFAEGEKVQCRLCDSTWTFHLFGKRNNIVLDKRMIDFGYWYVENKI